MLLGWYEHHRLLFSTYERAYHRGVNNSHRGVRSWVGICNAILPLELRELLITCIANYYFEKVVDSS